MVFCLLWSPSRLSGPNLTLAYLKMCLMSVSEAVSDETSGIHDVMKCSRAFQTAEDTPLAAAGSHTGTNDSPRVDPFVSLTA